ncbi:helix-turn-helix domain-containing protein [Sphingomonas flavalba]|uniref:helix-turn-helix domain-containing protein n=1 Tax=Sphingomonas flavalba TaxID=2559804 RepID=UPI00109DC35A|nr:helix-turn-helix domain-containing protein [Sphingomonas flavalba]
MAENPANEEGPRAGTVGARLRAGREAAGLDIADIAARTRIPQRHLEALEDDRLDALPSPTYSIGFARAYARAVGLDEVAIAADVRNQLNEDNYERSQYVAFEPADPARVPPRLLAWTAAVIALALIIGYVIWRTEWLSGPAPTVSTAVAEPAADAAAAPPADAPAAASAPLTGPVVLTATDTVWLRVTDATGKRLFEKEMQAGERYDVPADANAPVIRTGRPQALAVTIGGVAVPPLGDAEQTIDNVGISAAALAARPAPAAAVPVATPAPAPSVTTPLP